MGGVKVEEEGKGDAEGTTFDELCKMILPVSALKACRKGGKFACLPRQSRASEPTSHYSAPSSTMACVVNCCRKSRMLLPSDSGRSISITRCSFTRVSLHSSVLPPASCKQWTITQTRLVAISSGSSMAPTTICRPGNGNTHEPRTTKIRQISPCMFVGPAVGSAKANDRPSTHRPS